MRTTSNAEAFTTLLDLAPHGVCRAGRSPGRWWALTPPFHHFPTQAPGCVLSVALSVGFAVAGVTAFPLGSVLSCGVRTFLTVGPKPFDAVARRPPAPYTVCLCFFYKSFNLVGNVFRHQNAAAVLAGIHLVTIVLHLHDPLRRNG